MDALIDNNLTWEKLVPIVKAYNAKGRMIVQNRVIESRMINRIAIYRTKEKVIDDGYHITIAKHAPSWWNEVPEGWRSASGGEDITIDTIEKVRQMEKEDAKVTRQPERIDKRQVEEIRTPKYWFTHFVIPLLVAVSAAALLYLLIPKDNPVIVVDTPISVADKDNSPFIGTWKGSEMNTAYPQIIIRKDDLNRVWLDLYQHCAEPNCHLGKFLAKVENDTLTTRYSFENWSFALTAKIQNGRLFTNIEAIGSEGYTGPVYSETDFYERVSPSDQIQ